MTRKQAAFLIKHMIEYNLKECFFEDKKITLEQCKDVIKREEYEKLKFPL